MKLILLAAAAFFGYQYYSSGPNSGGGASPWNSITESVQSAYALISSSLPASAGQSIQEATSSFSKSMPSNPLSGSGCGEADALGNIKYCFAK